MSDVPLTKEERARRIRQIEREFPLLKSDSDSDADPAQVLDGDLNVSDASSTTIELSPVKDEENLRDSPFKTPVKPCTRTFTTPKNSCQERDRWEPYGDVDLTKVVPSLQDFPATTPDFKTTDEKHAFYKERMLRSRAITAKYKALGKETPFDEWCKMPAAWRIEDSYLNPGTPVQGLQYSDDSDSGSPAAKVTVKKRRIAFD